MFIRSQSGVNLVDITGKMIYTCKNIIYLDTLNLEPDINLGTYATEARAKQVMREIEEHIREEYYMRNWKGSSYDPRSLAIFKMPKEQNYVL